MRNQERRSNVTKDLVLPSTESPGRKIARNPNEWGGGVLNKNLLSRSSIESFRRQYQTAEPFPHIVFQNLFSDDFLESLLGDFDHVGFGDWLRYDTSNEVKFATRPGAKLGPSSQTYMDVIHRGSFMTFLSDVTGIAGILPDPMLFGGGLHEIPAGGKFGVHTDFNRHPVTRLDTRLVFLTYLNKDWDASYGGALELWDRSTNRCVQQVVPHFGTSILFGHSADSLHGHPIPVQTPDGRSRRSIAAYFYTNGRPDPVDDEFRTTHFHQPLETGRFGRVANSVKYFVPPAFVDAGKRIRRGLMKLKS